MNPFKKFFGKPSPKGKEDAKFSKNMKEMSRTIELLDTKAASNRINVAPRNRRLPSRRIHLSNLGESAPCDINAISDSATSLPIVENILLHSEQTLKPKISIVLSDEYTGVSESPVPQSTPIDIKIENIDNMQDLKTFTSGHDPNTLMDSKVEQSDSNNRIEVDILVEAAHKEQLANESISNEDFTLKPVNTIPNYQDVMVIITNKPGDINLINDSNTINQSSKDKSNSDPKNLFSNSVINSEKLLQSKIEHERDDNKKIPVSARKTVIKSEIVAPNCYPPLHTSKKQSEVLDIKSYLNEKPTSRLPSVFEEELSTVVTLSSTQKKICYSSKSVDVSTQCISLKEGKPLMSLFIKNNQVPTQNIKTHSSGLPPMSQGDADEHTNLKLSKKSEFITKNKNGSVIAENKNEIPNSNCSKISQTSVPVIIEESAIETNSIAFNSSRKLFNQLESEKKDQLLIVGKKQLVKSANTSKSEYEIKPSSKLG